MTEQLTPEQSAKAVLLKNDFSYYAPRCLKIKDKAGMLVPFVFNRSQQYLHDKIEDQKRRTGKVRILCVKGRQQGISTYIEGRFYHRTSMRRGTRAYILTHLQEATDNLFNMTRRYHENVPAVVRPSTRQESVKALTFDKLDSEYSVATAGTKGTGRSGTGQLFHGCLSPDSLIVSGATGALIRMRDLAIGDLVITHTGQIAAISFISEQQKIAHSIVMKGMRSIPLIATGEHRLWTRDGWKEVKDIAVGDKIGFPVLVIEDLHISWSFRLPDAIRPQGGGTRETGPDNVVPDYNLGRVLGLYLAEGSIVKQNKTKVPSAVTFAVHERETARTVDWLNAISNLFVSVKVAARKDSKTVTVTAYGKSFANFVLARCGELDNKRMPHEWDDCGKEFVRGIVHGYLSGDGHSSKRNGDRRISAPSIRSAITIGIRNALASLGYGWAGISWRDGAIRNGRNERAQWILRLCGKGVDRLVDEIGWSMPPRKRFGNYGDVSVEGGYAWVPVLSIKDAGMVDVMDFEVNHPDHSYCVLQGATHNSEAAFWPNAADHMAGIGQTIPNEADTEIILESTGNGVGNLFHGMVMDAIRNESDYELVFIPWMWQTEYATEPPPEWVPSDFDGAEYADLYGLTPAQSYWRERKIKTEFRGDSNLFDQEYPATVELAFRRQAIESLLPLPLIEKAMRAKSKEDDPVNGVEGVGQKIMAIDPAEYGSDDTVFTLRQGRVAPNVKRYHGRGPMEVVALAINAIEEWQPDMINVDAGGIGSGIADRLIELGYPVNRVLFGERAIEDDLYSIRKDEMAAELKKWLEDQPNRIVYDDALKADLSSPSYTYDSSRRLKVETKEHMRARGLKSPDGFDALCLTFAIKVGTMRKKVNRGLERPNWRTI